MGLKTVRVYKNTGFDGLNIPGSPSVLDAAQHTDYPDFYFLRESVDLPVIRIKDNYDNLADVDYVRITDNTTGKACYYFAAPKALAKGVTAIGLVLDALLTMGGADAQTYASGWMTRGHIAQSEDTLFSNVASEEFVPTRPLIVDKWQVLPTTNPRTDDLNVVITNTDIIDIAGAPDLTAEVIEGIVAGGPLGADPVMYLPKIKVVDTSTEFRVWDFDNESYKYFKLAGTAAYDPTNAVVKRGLSKLYSFGQLQLGASYQIPAQWDGGKSLSSDGNGKFDVLYGWEEVINLTNAPYEYVQGIKNKKVFALFRSAHLIALASGDTASYPIAETAGVENGQVRTNPRIRTWSDPSSTGKPYAGFADLHTGGGTGTGIRHAYADSVHGAQWSNSQIVVEGASGNAWAGLNTAMTRATQARAFENNILQNSIAHKTAESAVESAQLARQHFDELGGAESFADWINATVDTIKGGAIGAFAGFGPGGAILGATPGLVKAKAIPYEYAEREAATRHNVNNSIAQLTGNEAQKSLIYRAAAQERNQTTINDLQSRNVVAPSVMFSPEINLGLYGYNKFGYYETCMHPDDMLEADRYFQRFGYAGLHKPLTATVFNTRQYYNFVQASGVSIKTQGYGMRIRERAVAQLNAGVRVWHVLPDSSYYDLN